MDTFCQLSLAVCLILMTGVQISVQQRTFTIDQDTGTFLKDGQPFRYAAGSFHYFRATKDMWRDIMVKMKDGGLNVLETYVEWRSHEPQPGVYDFTGNLDVVSFIKLAQEVGLLVILRPGPYICAERDFGGFPYWLLREKPDIVLRSVEDPVYIKYVDKWFDVFLPMMKPLLYENGGPIILVQVENEYGQYPKCDHNYMTHLRDLNRKHLGDDVILFRTDIPLKIIYACDKTDGVMVTADFGPGTDVDQVFNVLKDESPNHPLAVTEFYVGWMDHWGEPHAKVDIKSVTKTLDDIFKRNGSVNIYMYFGGTNFGLSNGANAPYSIQPTSYDYSAPISEAGDLTDAYFQIREVIGKYFPLGPTPKPTPTPKTSAGPVEVSLTTTLLDSLSVQKCFKQIYSEYPLTFEALSVSSGFVAYSTMVRFNPGDPNNLQVPGLRDRGLVYVDQNFRGVLGRHENVFSIPLTVRKDQVITIIVENQGRINYGLEMKDPKGLVQNVTLGEQILDQWTMTPVPLNNIPEIQSYPKVEKTSCVFQPGYYTGKFTLPQNTTKGASTFLDPTGWHRGIAFINGFNLGRYWPVIGPQVTLFVPGSVLKTYPEENVLTLLELQQAPCTESSKCTVKFVETPILDGPVPTFTKMTEYLDFSRFFEYPDSFFNVPTN